MSESCQGKICLYPFSRQEIGSLNKYVPCCEAWLTPEYHRIKGGSDTWNGPAAQELRSRILKGDYSLCRRDICHIPLYELNELKENLNLHEETPISPANFEAMQCGSSYMPEGPQSIAVNVDTRCNLACPTCRGDHIFSLDAKTQWKLLHAEKVFKQHQKQIKVVKMAGNGEVFFSPFLRNLLKELHSDNYPNLDHIFLLSNGLLANQKNFDLLKPGSNSIRKVSISVDAGTEEVYQKVRGGNWKQLNNNLEWLSGRRLAGSFDYFNISFVVRAENFRTIPQFIQLGKELGVDEISFSIFDFWPQMGIQDYAKEAIHQRTHPLFSELFSIYQKHKIDSNVRFRMELNEG